MIEKVKIFLGAIIHSLLFIIVKLKLFSMLMLRLVIRNSKQIFWFISLSAITFVFRDKVSTTLVKYALLSDQEVLNNVFRLLFQILIVIIFIEFTWLILKNYRVSKKFNFIIFYLCASYISLRAKSGNTLRFSEFNSYFYYTDILLLIAFLSIILLFRNVFFRNFRAYDQLLDWSARKFSFPEPLKIGSNNNFLKEDLPLMGDMENDNDILIDSIISSISGFRPSESFIIGIDSEWGIGKTSFLKRLEYKILDNERSAKQQDSKSIVFWFNVWQHQDEKSILNNFFTHLKKRLSNFSGNASTSIDSYLEQLLKSADNKTLNFLNFQVSQLYPSSTIQEVYEDINNLINDVDRKIIVFVDDIDRLNKGEILETLRILRNVANFKNFIFICAYDRDYMVMQAGIKYGYLDKIFNLELPLIRINLNNLKTTLFGLLKTVDFIDEVLLQQIRNAFTAIFTEDESISLANFFIDIPDFPIEQNHDYVSGVQHIELIPTFFFESQRDVKRFYNEFVFNLEVLGDNRENIILKDYILLRLLLFKYKWIYRLFSVKRMTGWLGADTTLKFNRSEFDKYQQDGLHVQDINIITTVLGNLFPSNPVNGTFGAINQRRYISWYVNNNSYGDSYSISDLKSALAEKSLSDLLGTDIESYDDKNLLRHDLIQKILAIETIIEPGIYVKILNLIKTPELGFVTDNQILDLLHLGETCFKEKFDEILESDVFTNLNDPLWAVLIQLNRLHSLEPKDLSLRRGDFEDKETREKIDKYTVLTKTRISTIMISLAKEQLEKPGGVEFLLGAPEVFAAKTYQYLDFYLLMPEFKELIKEGIKNKFEEIFLKTSAQSTFIRDPKLLASIFEDSANRAIIEARADAYASETNSDARQFNVGDYVRSGMDQFYEFCKNQKPTISSEKEIKYDEFMDYLSIFKENRYRGMPTSEQIVKSKNKQG